MSLNCQIKMHIQGAALSVFKDFSQFFLLYKQMI